MRISNVKVVTKYDIAIDCKGFSKESKRKVQYALFQLGYEWFGYGKKFMHKKARILAGISIDCARYKGKNIMWSKLPDPEINRNIVTFDELMEMSKMNKTESHEPNKSKAAYDLLFSRVKSALGDRDIEVAGEDHLLGQVNADSRKARILDKIIDEFKIPAGGHVINWLRNKTKVNETKVDDFDALEVPTKINEFKPSWSDSPEWANYLAMDYDGEWYWFECEPYKNNFERWESPIGKLECAQSIPYDWDESLETRPE